MTLANVTNVSAQQLWMKQEKVQLSVQKHEIYQKKNVPLKYEIVRLNKDIFKKVVKGISTKQNNSIELPNFDGSLARFTIKETSNFDAILQAKFPNIRSYSAQGVDDPTAVAKISMGTDGFHAVIFSGTQETIYIDPYTKDNETYMVYKRSSLTKIDTNFKCLVEETVNKEFSLTKFSKNANDGVLRTFRFALVCSAEYAQFHLGAEQQNILDTATDLVKKEAVLSAMNTSVTRINGVFEKDLAVKLELVANNEELIFLDADTDEITDGNANQMLNEVQTICDATIGNDKYDIGHIFSTGGDGIAVFRSACVTGLKAKGVTGIANPVGDPFDIDYVIHELGHQFGANHTQSNDCNRVDSAAVEPGSGSTIMGYAGICAPNVQSGNPNGNSDAYFHAISIAEMWNFLQAVGTCAEETVTNNTAPIANAGLDYAIPKSTPFKLQGTASDADGLASLTYNWEQQDNEKGPMPPQASSTQGPMFRSLPSQELPHRFMPKLATIVAGNTASTWEVLPDVARELNFSFLVRDNYAGGGSSARDDMKVAITDAAAFTVSAPNTPVSWDVGSTQTIIWEKSTTDVAPINCSLVNIKLSIDGGLTFPIFLKTNTLNDGLEEVVIPNNATTTARIMVEAADNIFYNVNTTNFIIDSIIPAFLMTSETTSKAICNLGNQTVTYSFNFDFVNDFADTVTLSASGFPIGTEVVFNPQTISNDGAVSMTVSNLEGVTTQDYMLTVLGSSPSLEQQVEVSLKVVGNNLNKTKLISPQDNSENFELSGFLSWDADANAASYNVQISLNSNFNYLVFSKNVTDHKVQITPNLNQETTYFWRVQPVNSCKIGDFNDPFSFTTLACDVCEGFGSTEFETSTTLVQFNTINNGSEKEDANQGYSDFKSIDTTVLLDETYELSVAVNTDGNYRVQTKAWIDWNKDCLFDATEEYDLGSASDGVNIATSNSPLSIKVPENAKFGVTTLRVSSKYTDPDDILLPFSCERGFDGEVEDYSIVVRRVSVEDAVFDNFNLFPNPSDGTITLSFATEQKNDVSVQLFDLAGRLVDSQIFNNSNTYFTRTISFKVQSGGLFLLKINNNNTYTTRKLLIK
ncbi:T9SS type A sorting domain-containing protein [Polaribacter sp. IC066]|nr:T9SS type A sorting domain-containing protein [Polaribacter sp. IC063]TXD58193.1 T9SS type A sorting domain-containing protein [Polaribacter sp. IC066]